MRAGAGSTRGKFRWWRRAALFAIGVLALWYFFYPRPVPANLVMTYRSGGDTIKAVRFVDGVRSESVATFPSHEILGFFCKDGEYYAVGYTRKEHNDPNGVFPDQTSAALIKLNLQAGTSQTITSLDNARYWSLSQAGLCQVKDGVLRVSNYKSVASHDLGSLNAPNRWMMLSESLCLLAIDGQTHAYDTRDGSVRVLPYRVTRFIAYGDGTVGILSLRDRRMTRLRWDGSACVVAGQVSLGFSLFGDWATDWQPENEGGNVTYQSHNEVVGRTWLYPSDGSAFAVDDWVLFPHVVLSPAKAPGP